MNETRHGRPAAWSEAMSGAAMRCGRWFRRHARVLCIILLVACAVEVFGFNHYFWSTMGSTAIEQPKAVLGDGSDLKYGTTYQSDDGIALTVYPTSDATGAVDVESIDLKVSQTAEDGDGETVEYKPYGSATEDGTGTGGKSLLIIPNPTYDSWDNCHLTERITVYDEGHAEGHAVGPVDSGTSSWRGMNANGLDDDGAHVVCPAVQSSMYRSLKAAGAVSKIELDFHDAASEDLSLRIDSITLNEHVPMRFNILRVLLMALVTAGLLCLFERRSDRIKSFVVGIPPVDTGTRPSDDGATQAPAAERGGQVDGSRAGGTALDLEPQWRIVWALVLLGSLVGAVLLQMQAAETCVFPTYSQLTHSLTEGRIDIDYPWGEDKADIIRGMSNPYDTGERYKLAAPLLYDIAFHAGKFYLYFGIVPELLLFLPWYLLTGMDLSSTQALCVFDVALVIGGFLLVNELRRRLCPSMPRGLLMLLSVIVPGTILSFTMKTASVHPIANISGLAFVFWGLWLWLRSVRGVDSRGRGLSVWRAALGSLCMALAVGCRPTMALYSLLAFPVFWRVLVRPRS
ncbi:MAG: hypothetical protein PUF97_06635, partial [Bifidobacteriaceae bacterium]|nr:hypothetical protein [Bifidobacteriaceae bacterium]